MDSSNPKARRGGASIAIITIVSLAVIAALVLAVGRGRLFDRSDDDNSVADAYQDRVVVGWHPIPGLLPASSGGGSSDSYSVASALALSAGAMADEATDGDSTEQLLADLRSELIAFFDAQAGAWSGSGLPEEAMTAMATQALANSGSWPDEIDASAVAERSHVTLEAFVAGADTADPLLAADLLPWAQTAGALSTVDPTVASQLLARLPVTEACASAHAAAPVDGLLITPAMLTAIELSLLTGDTNCARGLAAAMVVDADDLLQEMSGPDRTFHMRTAHALERLGVVTSDDARMILDRGADAVSGLSASEIVPQIEDLAGLVNAGVTGVSLPSGFREVALVQYARGELNSVPERNAGLYLLIDGILGEFLPDTRRELRTWVDPAAPDLSDHERLVIAALGIDEMPATMPAFEELDGTSEVALLIAYSRFGSETCPLLQAWPEQPTGAFAVAIRNLAIECGSTEAALGPDMATFVADVVASQPWEPGEEVLASVQLTRGVASACLVSISLDSVPGLAAALDDANAIIETSTAPGESEFGDWSRAIASAYSTNGCPEVINVLVP